MNMLGDGRDSLGSGEEWARVRGRLRAEVGDAAFRSWLKPLTMVGAKNGVARMSVPTRFMRDWVVSNYVERIQILWQDEGVGIERVEIVVQPPPRPAPKPECAPRAAESRLQPAFPKYRRYSVRREGDSAIRIMKL